MHLSGWTPGLTTITSWPPSRWLSLWFCMKSQTSSESSPWTATIPCLWHCHLPLPLLPLAALVIVVSLLRRWKQFTSMMMTTVSPASSYLTISGSLPRSGCDDWHPTTVVNPNSYYEHLRRHNMRHRWSHNDDLSSLLSSFSNLSLRDMI